MSYNYEAQYKLWLDVFSQDRQIVKELLSIQDDEKEKEDRFYTELSFGTAGMRGILGAGRNRINKYTVRRATKGLAEFLKKDPQKVKDGVVIAYDSRRFSQEFAEEAALTLCENGISTQLFDSLRPVPILSFAIRHLKCAAGIVITASHNPPQYNGYKVYGEDGAQLSLEDALIVMEEMDKTSYGEITLMDKQEALEKGLLKIIGDKEVDDVYMERLKTLSIRPEKVLSHGKDLRIVYTPLHGSGNIPVRRILKEIGVTNVAVVKEQELPDPNFSTIEVPNPEDPKAFIMAIEMANKIGADIVFGTDPDCDRVGIGVRNREGNFELLTGNQIGCLLLHYILDERKKKQELPNNAAAIKSIVSTQMAQAICDDYGVSLFNTLTGFKFIGELIENIEQKQSHKFQFAFEESYGYLSSTFVRDKDGVNAAMLIAELAVLCHTKGISLYERLRGLYKKYGYFKETVFSKTLPGKDGVEKMQEIMKNLRQSPPTYFGEFKVIAIRDYLTGIETIIKNKSKKTIALPTSDVLYYELEKGAWCCIRPSGTEPKIKLYINTQDFDEKEAERQNTCLSQAAEALLS